MLHYHHHLHFHPHTPPTNSVPSAINILPKNCMLLKLALFPVTSPLISNLLFNTILFAVKSPSFSVTPSTTTPLFSVCSFIVSVLIPPLNFKLEQLMSPSFLYQN